MELYLSLGSNLGDRKSNILQALRMLDEALGVPYSRLSSIDESVAWGFDGPAFLDAVAVYEIPDSGAGTMDKDLSPTGILAVCKDIERRLGRTGVPEYDAYGKRIYHDRPIDIDILLYGTMEIRTRELTVPHRLISVRDFIKKPLREVISADLARHFKDILE